MVALGGNRDRSRRAVIRLVPKGPVMEGINAFQAIHSEHQERQRTRNIAVEQSNHIALQLKFIIKPGQRIQLVLCP